MKLLASLANSPYSSYFSLDVLFKLGMIYGVALSFAIIHQYGHELCSQIVYLFCLPFVFLMIQGVPFENLQKL